MRPLQDAFARPTSFEDVKVECITSGCPNFGRRWTYPELLEEIETHARGERRTRDRPAWDDQFMEIARITARRATCDRSQVGCVLTLNRRIVSTGYNGSFAGADHCDEVGHHMVDGRCLRTVHAEANAIADAARRGVSVEGGTAYLTRLPCVPCLKLLIAAGIARVVCGSILKPEYLEGVIWFAREGDVDLVYPEPG